MPTISDSAGSAQRRCLACDRRESIAPNAELWPTGWRCDGCGWGPPVAHGFVQLAPEADDVDAGFDLASFNLLLRYEAQHFWFLARNEMIRWLVQRYAPDARRVMEIGCGTGFVLQALREALPQANVAGSELHSLGLQTARARHGEAVELIQMSAERSGLASAFDLVGAFDVIEHIPHEDAVLREIVRMLKPRGVFIATVPQHPALWSISDDLAHHQRRYRIRQLSRATECAGLTTLYTTSFVVLAFPAMLAARLVGRKGKMQRTLREQVEAELAIPPRLNRALLALCRFEHRLRRMGVPLPFGGSQVLVARRAAAQ